MVSEVKQAVIMVGGKGTRLRPLTETRPKPVLPVLDKPCLRYLIDSLVRAGIKQIFLACGYKSEKLVEAIGDGSNLGVSIVYSYEDEPLGTGGAIKKLESKLDDVFIAANGDTFADIDVMEEISTHVISGAAVTIALTIVKNPCDFGIVRLGDGDRILEFKEKPTPEEVFSNLVNAGIYVVNKSVLVDIPADSFYDFSKDLVPVIMSKGERIQGYIIKGVWKDVGRPADLLSVNLIMATRLYDDFGWGGKRVGESEIHKPFYLGDGSTAENSKITAAVILKGCRVYKSKVSNSLIMAGCEVITSIIENSILGEGCKIMPGSSVINSVLGDGTIVESGKTISDNKVL
jgi:mannose-1-phosphate guanylyltransferase